MRTRLKLTKELRRIAYHEAGHAVAAVALRIPVVSATIRSDRDAGEAGHVKFSTPFVESLPWDDGRKLRAYAVQAAAGVMAEAIYRTGKPAVRDDLRGGGGGIDYSNDYGIVCDAALSCMGHDALDHGPFFERTLRRAEKLLLQRWPAVERVAAALLEHTTLTGLAVRAIVSRDAGKAFH